MARKKKQTEIPGTERVVDEAVSDAAEALHLVRNQRMKLSEQESEAAETLLTVMREKGLESYVDEDLELRVIIKHGADKVSVTKIKPSSTGESEAEAAE